jgi:hypothetical protein
MYPFYVSSKGNFPPLELYLRLSSPEQAQQQPATTSKKD